MRYLMTLDVPKEVDELYEDKVGAFIEWVMKSRSRSMRSRDIEAAQDAFKVFLYNCVVASLTTSDITISLREGTYSQPLVRNGRQLRKRLSYTFTKASVAYLSELKCIEVELGSVTRWCRDRQYKEEVVEYKFIPNKKPTVLKLVNAFKEEIESYSIDLSATTSKDVVHLRGENKQTLKFSGKLVQDQINSLQELNERALESQIMLGGKDITASAQFRKIYNGDLETGGRIYDRGIQCLPKHRRAKITIDGDKTVSLDYKSFETSIAYSLCGELALDDPYTCEVDGYDKELVRSICKQIMTRLYYVGNKAGLKSSMEVAIKENLDIDGLYEQGKIPMKQIPIGMFINKLLEKHTRISSYFYGKGEKNLQYVGSQILDHVVFSALENYNEIVLPVFDEVICSESLTDEVEALMVEGFNKIVGTVQNCKISRD